MLGKSGFLPVMPCSMCAGNKWVLMVQGFFGMEFETKGLQLHSLIGQLQPKHGTMEIMLCVGCSETPGTVSIERSQSGHLK